MDLKIKAKRALVIGATSGLGQAAAGALCAEGADVVLLARGEAALRAGAEALAARFGRPVETLAADITRREDLARAAARLGASGGLDILIVNTPRPPSPMRDFLDETDDARWQEACTNQLFGALNVLREFPPLMRGRGWGRIVAITSASVKQPMPRHAVSTVFRAGVHAALKHLAMELGPEGITVNAVAPATIVTPTFSQFHNLEARIQGTLVRRAGTPEELGATVAFLASGHAGFITGQTIQLDGGMTAALL